MSETPEKDRLVKRLFSDPKRKLVNIHVSWGPEAHKLTPEGRARVLNEAFDAVERGDATPVDCDDGLEKRDVRSFVLGLK